MTLITGLSTKYLWEFAALQSVAKSGLELTAEEAKTFVEKDDPELLARRIQHVPFPYETFDEVAVKSMRASVSSLWTLKGDYVNVAQMIPQESDDSGRSHMIINGERWGANHSYSPAYWKPLIINDKVALILNDASGNPGRLVDHFTHERFNSSTVRTGYVSPVEGWKNHRTCICKKLIKNIKYVKDQCAKNGIPHAFTRITARDFREATLDKFPCSYHFPPTALMSTVAHLRTRSPDLFKEGFRILDPSAGHGHRLIGAIGCPEVAVYAGTDPNEAMQEGYQKIIEALNLVSTPNRRFSVVRGVAEDPNNPVYKVDKLYNLVFTSPPFFNTEAYGDGKDQATTTYTTFEKWVSGFLEPMLTNCWKVLAPGGYMAINLTDAHTNQCVEALITIATQILKGDYLGMIPSRKAVGAARWIAKEARKVTIKHGIDPIWVIQKPAC